jgi:hypothetical protein
LFHQFGLAWFNFKKKIHNQMETGEARCVALESGQSAWNGWQLIAAPNIRHFASQLFLKDGVAVACGAVLRFDSAKTSCVPASVCVGGR